MQRLFLFFVPGALLIAAVQLHRQHVTGAGLAPQQQAITQAAAEVHQSLCR